MGNKRLGVLLAILGASMLAVLAVGGLEVVRRIRERQAANARARDPATILAQQEARVTPYVDLAPVAVPTSLPLVGGDGVMPDGYPVAHVDGAALRSLLWHEKYADLNRYFVQLQDAFAKDYKREYWIGGAGDAFGSAEPSLETKLDAWVAATPQAFAPYFARGAHLNAVSWARRGRSWSKDTPEQDMAAMHEASSRAVADLDRALAIEPRLVAAMLLRIRALTAASDHAQMRAQLDKALEVCPSCFRLRAVYLLDTTPRWGGSYEAMHAFAATCDPKLNVRCKVLDGFVDFDRADLAWIDGRLPDAAAAMDRAVALGDCAPFLVERSQIRHAMHDDEGALADADRALALWYSADSLSARSDALRGLQRSEPAARALLDALRLEPTHVRARGAAPRILQALLADAQSFARAGRLDEALRLLDLAAELAPSERAVLNARAWVLQGGEKPDVATAEAAAERSPDDLRAHRQLDYALSSKGDFPRIAAMWTAFIARHPDEGRAYMERSGTYSRLGKRAESHADAAKACDLGISEGCLAAR